MGGHSVTITTIDSEAGVEKLVAAALDAKLAACAQAFAIESFYTWKGERRREREWRIEFKHRREDGDALRAALLAAHSYETPEILRVDVADGHPDYLAWVDAQTRRT